MATTQQSAGTTVICSHCGARNRIDLSRAAHAQPKCGRCGHPLEPGQASSHPIVVTDATFDRDVLALKDRPVLVDFWAPWCGPCRMLAPTLEDLAAHSNGRYLIAKLNTDENPRSAAHYKISGIPAMLIFKDGKQVDEIIGLAPKHAIVASLSKWQ